MTSRTVLCKKLNQSLPAMTNAPYPGELGQRILNSISQQAWDQWLGHQTMLINEYRLSLIDPNAKQFLKDEMEKFLFEAGSSTPPGFQPTDESET